MKMGRKTIDERPKQKISVSISQEAYDAVENLMKKYPNLKNKSQTVERAILIANMYAKK